MEIMRWGLLFFHTECVTDPLFLPVNLNIQPDEPLCLSRALSLCVYVCVSLSFSLSLSVSVSL